MLRWEQGFRWDREEADCVFPGAGGRGAEEERGAERGGVEESEVEGSDGVAGAEAVCEIGEIEGPLSGVPEREERRQVRWKT